LTFQHDEHVIGRVALADIGLARRGPHLLRLAEKPVDLIVGQIGEYRYFEKLRLVGHLHLAEILVDELHGYGPFANSRSHPLDRTMAHISDGEDSRDVGLEEKGIAVEMPPAGRLAIVKQIGAGQDESALVTLDGISQPVGLRQRAYKNEDGGCRDAF